MGRRLAMFSAIFSLAGCPGGDGGGSGTTGAVSTTGGATDTASTTFVDADACLLSEECGTGGLCVAAYDPAAQGGPTPGSALCSNTCIEQDDLVRWCFDDDACCGDLQCNLVDGFCLPGPTVGTGTSSGGASSTGSDTGSGSGSGSDSGSGSGSGSGSDTGLETGSSGTGTSSG